MRDLALQGFHLLKEGEPGAPQEFHRRAAELVARYLLHGS
jgi:hypothetical protein